MTNQDLESQLLTLSSADQADVIQALSLSGRCITKTPGVCGGEACIDGRRIAVWLLIEAKPLGITEAQLLADYGHITAVDLVNA